MTMLSSPPPPPSRNIRARRAQAVVEFAAFGAIVIYLIGLIMAQGMNSATAQDTQLQAMRLSLLISNDYSKKGGAPGSSSRNSASFMILEDRFSPGVGKYGPSDRQPLMVMGNGTLSKNLFKPSDWSDMTDLTQNDIPTMDVRINGQHFELRSGMAVTERIRFYRVAAESTVTSSGLAPTTYAGNPDKSNALDGNIVTHGSRVTISRVNGCSSTDVCSTNCEDIIEDSDVNDYPRDNMSARRLSLEWFRYGADAGNEGYPPAYRVIVVNSPDFQRIEDGNDCPSPSDGSWDDIRALPKYQKLRRYDWNRDGNMPDMCCLSPLKFVLWQWLWYPLSTVAGEIDGDNGTYPSYDVDGDLEEEPVYRVSKLPQGTCNGQTVDAYDVDVIAGRGDVDGSADLTNLSKDELPGIKDNMWIKTASPPSNQPSGTGDYLEIRETGNGTNGRAADIAKKNQQDFIERIYVLNRRMLDGGSLCSAADVPLQDSVQACCHSHAGCCTEAPRNAVTCLEFPPHETKKLYIRSRIDYKNGRAYITNTTPAETLSRQSP